MAMTMTSVSVCSSLVACPAKSITSGIALSSEFVSSAPFQKLGAGSSKHTLLRVRRSLTPQAKYMGKSSEELDRKASNAADYAGQKGQDAGNKAKEATRDAGHKAKEATRDVGNKAREATHNVGYKARDTEANVRDKSGYAQETTQRITGLDAPGGVLPLVVAVAIPVILGSIVASKNQPQSSIWYRNLKKPSWNPPDAVFGAAWSVLYPIIGYSGWRIWVKGGWERQSGALTIFVIQLVLNLAYPIICFGKQNLGLAFFDLVALFISIFSCLQSFAKVDEVAARLLWPYLIWVGFASVLNFNLWRRNQDPPSGTSYNVQSAFST